MQVANQVEREQRELRAIVGTAPSTWTATPPSAGPPRSVTAWVPDIRLLRLCSRSAGSIAGRNVVLATSKSTLAKLTTNATIASWATVSQPCHQASGMDATAPARARSAATCTPRSGTRCTITPAGSPSTNQAA